MALACGHIVFRALLKRGWVDPETGNISAGAFLLRPSEEGLSVDIDSPAKCVAPLNKTFGVASLHVGRVRDLGLDVVPDIGTHANLTGLPHAEVDPGKAEFLAGELARTARFIPPAPATA